MSVSKSQVLGLYKQIIKNASRFNDYNFKQYFLRKARTEFKANKGVADAAQIEALVKDAQKDLGVLKRQSIISQMYTFDKLVVEPLPKK